MTRTNLTQPTPRPSLLCMACCTWLNKASGTGAAAAATKPSLPCKSKRSNGMSFLEVVIGGANGKRHDEAFCFSGHFSWEINQQLDYVETTFLVLTTNMSQIKSVSNLVHLPDLFQCQHSKHLWNHHRSDWSSFLKSKFQLKKKWVPRKLES